MAPLTPFRHYVMGEESMERAATPDGDGANRGPARGGDAGGRAGLLDDVRKQHVGFQGRPLACGNASREEIRAYCRVLRERGRER